MRVQFYNSKCLQRFTVPVRSIILPDAVEDVPVLKDPQQLVISGDLVEVGALLVSKEQVRFPDGVQHGGVQVERVVRVLLICQARIVPLLPEEHVQAVVLRRDGESEGDKRTEYFREEEIKTEDNIEMMAESL